MGAQLCEIRADSHQTVTALDDAPVVATVNAAKGKHVAPWADGYAVVFPPPESLRGPTVAAEALPTIAEATMEIADNQTAKVCRMVRMANPISL